MRNLLALGAAGLIGFAGIGWYLGWYKFETSPTATGRHISIDLNSPKIQHDVVQGEEKLRDYLSKDGKPTPGAPTTPTPGTPTGFQRGNENEFIYPGNPPPAPSSGTSFPLPPPR